MHGFFVYLLLLISESLSIINQNIFEMKRNFLLVAALCFAALILTSCNKEKGEQNDFVKLSVRDALNSERDVFLSEIASSIEYIPLETSDKSLVASLHRPILIDGTFYIIDNKWKDIKRFGRDGKFLGYVGGLGRAKGEFTSANPFNLFVDNEKGYPHIFDNTKLIEYNPEGSFVREIYVPDFKNSNAHIFKMIKFSSYYFIDAHDFSSGKPHLIILDSLGSPLNPMPNFDKPEKSEKNGESDGPVEFMSATPAHIYMFNGLLRIITPDCDSIISFDKSLTRSVAYVIDYGNSKKSAVTAGNDRENSISAITTFTTESDNAIFLSLRIGENIKSSEFGEWYRALYNKRSGEFNLLRKRDKRDAIINDIDGGIAFWPINHSPQGELIMPLSAIQFIDAAEKSKSPEMKRVAATLKEDSNPVIVVVKLKK
jgi:hypothetical protein